MLGLATLPEGLLKFFVTLTVLVDHNYDRQLGKTTLGTFSVQLEGSSKLHVAVDVRNKFAIPQEPKVFMEFISNVESIKQREHSAQKLSYALRRREQALKDICDFGTPEKYEKL